MQQILNAVDSSCVLLAEKIKSALLRLPSSSLWGSREQFAKLKLLVSLDMNKQAAEIYIRGEKRAIKRVMKTLDFSSDSLVYITELSKQSFIILARSIHTCIELFDLMEHSHSNRDNGERGQRASPGRIEANKAADKAKTHDIMSIVLLWMKDEICVLVDLVSKKVQSAVHEYAALILIHIRKTQLLSANQQDGNGKQAKEDTAYSELLSNSRARPLPRAPVNVTDLPSSFGTLPPHETGALSYLSTCLDRVMAQARQAQNETARVCVGWILLPEIEKFMRKYTDEFAKEIEIEVRLEPWRPVMTLRVSYVIQLPGSILLAPPEIKGSSGTEPATNPVSRAMPGSFLWMVDVLQHFLYEVYALLKVEYYTGEAHSADSGQHHSNELLPPSTTSEAATPSSSASPDAPGYSRADIGEVEVTAMSCLLSLVVRYVLELEQVDVRLLDSRQVQVLSNCQQCLLDEVLPSLQRVIASCCVLEPSKVAAATAFQVLIPRLQSLAAVTNKILQS